MANFRTTYNTMDQAFFSFIQTQTVSLKPFLDKFLIFSIGPVNPKPASLLYETVKSYRSDVTMATLIKAIQDASHEEEPDVVPTNAAKTFSHFVSILQEVNKNELLIAHDQVKSKAGFKNSETAM